MLIIIYINKKQLLDKLEKSLVELKELAANSWGIGYYTAIEDVIEGIKNTDGFSDLFVCYDCGYKVYYNEFVFQE